ncbi:Tetratricopeptide repeat protein [Phycisphaerae bacterium RAS1]|nr:Tetratricopeptide repeat protein [Phycisphaerae bacterium RAS1]
MAEKTTPQPEGAGTFSEGDKSKARQWFKKAMDCRERREYDYAIECYITGLSTWPEAVEEAHMPLRSLAVQRMQAGGKKPGMMDSFRKPTSGKDAKQAMLNAEQLLSMDPDQAKFIDALLRNAAKGGYVETTKWVAPLALSSMKKDKKPDRSRFKAFRECLILAADKADATGRPDLKTWLLEQAVQSIDFQVARTPGDEDLRNEQRDLSGKLTISRGKYDKDDTFRESLQDGDSQRQLHDAERVKQGESTYATLVETARKEYEANPTVPGKINAYTDALLKSERDEEENLAVDVLMRTFEQTRNYSFKLKADDIRLRQMKRRISALKEKAAAGGADADRASLKAASHDYLHAEHEIIRERVAQYPTDLRLKYRLGQVLFSMGQFDETIPILQAAQAEPKYRVRCQLLMGCAFFEKKQFSPATEVLADALASYELTDETTKQLLYWLGRAHEANGKNDDAKAVYGRLLLIDYNYRNGEVRKRSEALG